MDAKNKFPLASGTQEQMVCKEESKRPHLPVVWRSVSQTGSVPVQPIQISVPSGNTAHTCSQPDALY